MKVIDLYHETRTSLFANISRTFLTVLGIVIGIASVIVMLAVGQGAQNSISSSINALGSNVLTVRPGGPTAPGTVDTGNADLQLTVDDVTAIQKNVASILNVAPSVQSRTQVTAPGKNVNTTVIGATPPYALVSNVTMDEGNFITDSQNNSFSKVAVLGSNLKTNLFGDNDPIGQEIKIKTNTYIIVGIAASQGGTGFTSPDDNIYVPLTTAQQYLTGGNKITTIAVEADNANNMTQIQTDLTYLLVQIHKITDPAYPGFRILNQATLLNTASSITSIFTILLGSVAGISLVVGGIGIMNMMLTTVRERTKEIGFEYLFFALR